ncbi:uncharacterized protein LOC119601977 isoform X1 [Lucilia sericata]|uniref:uncharacterized protein LOC119601977 isoform X1 n=1 Tax=Lucilia sericata TaxID=13632 RepID=UPI0018A87869|nr:uncharacterized protein LOC119601977 isoform X1 [Lucilia sericata]
MQKYLAIIFSFIILIHSIGLNHAALYVYKNDTKEDYKRQPTSNINTATTENRESIHHLNHNNWNFHNTSKNLPIHDTQIENRPYTDTESTYSPAKYKIVNYNNVDVVYNKHPLDNSQYQFLENIYDLKQRGRSSLLKQLQSQKQELSRGYADFIYDPYQLATTPKETTVSSNDHYKTRYLASYVTPSPSHSEMHPNLHHHIPRINNKKTAIVSHATGNEPSPMTTTSIKSLTSIENMQQFLTKVNGVKYIRNNKLNDYDNTAEVVSEFVKPVNKEGSKQYLFAPMRPSLERELPYSSNTLPYPPSFISITTTEKPLFSFKSEHHKIPDLFSHRQSKSLWDSYIPSWQITKMLQQYKTKPVFNNKNNLHTLAFARQYKNEREKRNV